MLVKLFATFDVLVSDLDICTLWWSGQVSRCYNAITAPENSQTDLLGGDNFGFGKVEGGAGLMIKNKLHFINKLVHSNEKDFFFFIFFLNKDKLQHQAMQAADYQ